MEQWGGMKARRRWLRSDWGGVLLRKTLKNPYFQSVQYSPAGINRETPLRRLVDSFRLSCEKSNFVEGRSFNRRTRCDDRDLLCRRPPSSALSLHSLPKSTDDSDDLANGELGLCAFISRCCLSRSSFPPTRLGNPKRRRRP